MGCPRESYASRYKSVEPALTCMREPSMNDIIINYADGGYVCSVRGGVLFVKGNGKSRTRGCILHVVVRVEPTHDVIVIPQAAHAKKIGVKVGMTDYIV